MNLATHVTDIVNVIKWEGLRDIVLVGHSYGGAVVSGVAEQMHDAIGSFVFLDAFVPENGDSVAAMTTRRDAIEALVQKGETSMKPVPAAVFQVNEKDRAWVDGKCTPHPLATLTDKIAVTGARNRIAKKSYIRATGYPNVPFDSARDKLKADRGLAHLRDAVRPRCHGRHARPVNGDLDRGGVAWAGGGMWARRMGLSEAKPIATGPVAGITGVGCAGPIPTRPSNKVGSTRAQHGASPQ